ncbi:MAG: succinate dehydrogenase, hydrophobic membrane anchor protein [Pseudomonadota bacterium]|jgi:succinate dehydrogenase / fumarate reductase membrane anchor subunit|nr:succinate dehydrogenase, hydrophobic membrane anchor protein [Pseudomonadota bacterium]MEC7605387.1 succinate dehydrogenase, hydrophobic membrane anchor protein [Pseudomonadota bacterium]MEC7996728.1 succinate dehydrogenase, hydrophobic membrane anchor protein [Pseudomonadota bacterium]MEC8429984.1 succinate dehydrogenase, hydrophobic membrane anchor protein [Pseudomonadota bacterium]MEC8804946.1 succinate dehydrogenase, hydrophobic membrane anchor protein [Pseudomonadota bacterium]
MVTNATNFSRSGLSDWIIQRFSAVILAAYTLFILAVLVSMPELNYESWREVFSKNSVRLFSVIALLALGGHTWVGMWTVGTDYLTDRQLGGKGTFIRLIYQSFCVLLIAVYLLWGIQIFWGS